MGFNRNTARNNNNEQSNDSWKSAGFINIYLPSKDGKRRKLGAISLREGSAEEKKLFDWLKEKPARVESILAAMQLEFRSAEPAEGSGFALPVDEEPAPAGT